MTNAINPKPGDVYALPAYRNSGPPTQIHIERVTATQAIDTKGRRWGLKHGTRVGSSSERIHPWTDADTAQAEEHERAREYRRCLDALGAVAYHWPRLPTGDALARALPHLQSAVAALGLTESEAE